MVACQLSKGDIISIILLRERIKGTAIALSIKQHGLCEARAIQHGT